MTAWQVQSLASAHPDLGYELIAEAIEALGGGARDSFVLAEARRRRDAAAIPGHVGSRAADVAWLRANCPELVEQAGSALAMLRLARRRSELASTPITAADVRQRIGANEARWSR